MTATAAPAMELTELIRQLAQVLHLPGLEPETDGSCAFRVHGITVLLAPRPAGEHAFIARASLGALAGPVAAQCLPLLMSANFFADGIGGAAASLDGQGDVYLTQHFALGTVSAPYLLACLQRFVAQARRCQALLPSEPAPAAWPLLAEGVVQA